MSTYRHVMTIFDSCTAHIDAKLFLVVASIML